MLNTAVTENMLRVLQINYIKHYKMFYFYFNISYVVYLNNKRIFQSLEPFLDFNQWTSNMQDSNGRNPQWREGRREILLHLCPWTTRDMTCTVLRNSPRNKTGFGWVLVFDGSQMHARLADYSWTASALDGNESKNYIFQVTVYKVRSASHMNVFTTFCVL